VVILTVALSGVFGIAIVGKALEYGLIKKGRFKVGETILGEIRMPAIDRITKQEPASISRLGMSKFSIFSIDGSIDSLFYDVNSKLTKLQNGLGISVPSGDEKPHNSTRKTIKSLSGVTLAYQDSPLMPVLLLTEEKQIGVKKTSGLLKGISDAFEVIGACRGIGWDYGESLYVPPQTRPLERKAFIKGSIKSFLVTFFLFDFIESCLNVIPGFSYPGSRSIFFMDAPPSFLRETQLWPWIQAHHDLSTFITKYTVSTLLTFVIGSAIIAGFTMDYEILILIFVGLLGDNPENWPPLLDEPWLATSLADFWGKRWHQTFRQTFFIFGGYPLQFIIYHISLPLFGKKSANSLGRVGLVLGTFIASGLIHALAFYGMDSGGVDNSAIIFFGTQGVLLLAERAWKLATGIRVGGWYGRIWTYCIVLIGIQCTSESPPQSCYRSSLANENSRQMVLTRNCPWIFYPTFSQSYTTLNFPFNPLTV
jgi:hypothetical protein